MRYRVLGPVSAAEGSEPAVLGGPRARAVLALLLADVGRVVSDRRMLSGIWGDAPPEGARHAVQSHVSRLRSAIADDIVREAGGYRLAADPASVDAHRFTSLVASGRERLADAPAAAGRLLRDGLALWRGEPYADLADVPGLQGEIRRLTAARLSAVEDRVQADLDDGGHRAVIAELDALVREHPFRERLYGMQMVALYRAGRQAEALEVWARARVVLADELGIDPSPELADLHARVLAQDPGLRADPATDRSSTTSVAQADGGLPVVRGFELREQVGEGDFGRTYRAFHAALGREVAVKVLHGGLADLPDVVAAFERRAQRVAQLDHPHVLPLLDHWRAPGAAYLVTPWSPAGTVRTAVRHGPWSPVAALRMVEQVGAALDLAHRRGIVHGDVKAANIVLSDDGSARLTDFALAPRPCDTLGAPRTTDIGAIPPEERRGAATSTAGDVYGLAAVAITALTGAPAPADRPAAALGRPAGQLPAEAVAALADATATDPGDRPDRIVDLVRRLRRAFGADVVPPTALAHDDPAVAVRNPYKGLHAFTEDDAIDFFGRSEVVERLLATVAGHRLTAVVGPSGSGKSSLVRAGAIPSLRAGSLPGSQHWLIADLYPGSHPFDELAVALLRIAVDPPDGLVAALTADDRGLARVVKQILPADDSQLLLVIDQFEELFSLTDDTMVRQRFLDSLVALADDARGRVRTIITLRADFYDRPLVHHDFGELLHRGLVSLPVPSRDELAEAVAAPARQVGVEFAPGLVAQVVGDLADQPGGLPLLQHALTELFARRDGHLLTEQAYDEAGGVRGALARRAEELHAALPADRQELARQLFLRLVAVDEHSAQTRRRARRSELAGLTDDRAAIDDVLQRFGAHRLLTFDRDLVTRGSTIEVAHEALLTEWGRLRRWIEDRRDHLLVHRRLALATAEWRAAADADGFLVTGPRLAQFAEFAAATDLALDRDERAFLSASRAYDDRARGQRRRQRWLALSALAGVVVLAVVLIGVGLVQRGRATVRGQAEHAATLAAASRAAHGADADLALLLARAAVRVARAAGAPAGDALGALHEAVLNHRVVANFDVGTHVVRFLDEDHLIGPATAGGGPRVYRVGSGRLVRTLEPLGGSGDLIDIDLSRDGRRWVEAYEAPAPATVWDVAAGEVVQRIPVPRDGWDVPALDPTGAVLAIADFGGRDDRNVIRVYDVRTGAQRWHVRLDGQTTRLAVSPDGGLLAAAMASQPLVRLFDLRDGDPVGEITGPADARGAASVAFDPDGSTVAVVSPTGILQLHRLADGEVAARAQVDAEGPFDVCYSADGATIAVTAIGSVDTFTGGGANLSHVADANLASRAGCGPDGTRVAAASVVNRARVWDVTAAPSEVWSAAAPAPSAADWIGTAVVTAHGDRRLRRWVPGRAVTATSAVALPDERLPLTTDGARLIATQRRPEAGDAAAQGAPRLVIRDAHTLGVVRATATTDEPQALDADGTRLLSSAFDAVHLVDTRRGTIIATLDHDWSGLTPPAAAFLAGGRYALADDLDTTVLFDLLTGRPVAVVCATAFSSRVVASPTGALFAVDGPRGIEVYDADRLVEAGAGAARDCGSGNPGAAARVSLLDGPNVRFMDFSPDGTRLATVAEDGTVSLWDPRTGALELAIHHDGDVGGGTFSADGRRLAVTVHDSGSDQGSVRIYTLDVDELLDIADHRVMRGLTAEECAGYRIPEPCGPPTSS